MSASAIRFPRSTAGLAWLCGFAALLVAIGVAGMVSAPEPGPIIAAIAIVLIVAAVVRMLMMGTSQLVDGTLHHIGFLHNRQVPIAGARNVTLEPSSGGFGQLRLVPAHGRPVHLQLMLNAWPFVGVCMRPDDLDRLGEALLATGHAHAQDLRTILHLQAEHLRAGGSLATSPLRAPSHADGRKYLGDSTLTMLLRRAHSTHR
jgi:hypothetical protein